MVNDLDSDSVPNVIDEEKSKERARPEKR